MSVPKMLRERVLNPQGSESLVCSSIAQVARKPEYAVEEAFEILIQAFHAETRVHVLVAVLEGIADVVARARHADTLAMQMAQLLGARNEKNARLLTQLVATRETPQLLRLRALDLLAAYTELDLEGVMLGRIEETLWAHATAADEDPIVRRRIMHGFGPSRASRPRLGGAGSPRGDETTAL